MARYASPDIGDPKLRNLQAARCTVCGEYFQSDAGFRRHRIGDDGARRCLAPAEMERLGMVKNARGLRFEGKSLKKLGLTSIVDILDGP